MNIPHAVNDDILDDLMGLDGMNESRNESNLDGSKSSSNCSLLKVGVNFEATPSDLDLTASSQQNVSSQVKKM